MRHLRLLIVLLCVGISAGCREKGTEMAKKTFGEDLEFLKKHTDVVVLSDGYTEDAGPCDDQHGRGDRWIELRLD